jgi:redox-sensitive bicupin YhaK (pirin superfamily)
MSGGDVEVIINSRDARIDTFSVRRTLPTARRRMVGPFTFLDHMGPVTPAEGRVNVLPHPHIGLATLTYIFEGELLHRDSLGNTQAIRPREVNWMVAGRGIAHSERAPLDPSFLRMNSVQAWVALPVEAEEAEPSFVHAGEHDLPAFLDRGFTAQLLAGSAYGLSSAVPAYSPLFYVAARIAAGASMPLPDGYAERAAYVVSGSIEHGGHTFTEAQLVVFTAGRQPVISARVETQVLLLGGEPVGRRYMWWNFVSSRKERIDEAKADWAEGRIALPPDDNQEFVPLPHDRWPLPPEPEPMS